MTDADTPDVDAAEAKATLERAIRDYYGIVQPEVIILDWVLVTQKDSVQLTAGGTTAVGVLVANDQSFVTTRGMLDIALINERFHGMSSEQ